jgi:hypothetical protein
MMQFRTLLEVLLDNEVELILIGGVAGIIHGSARAAGRPKDFEAIAELNKILKKQS